MISLPLWRQLSEPSKQVKFVTGFSRRIKTNRSCEQFPRWNAKTIGERGETVCRDLPFRIVFKPIDIACGDLFSITCALLGYICK